MWNDGTLASESQYWVWDNEWEIILLSVHNHSAAWLRMVITLFIARRWCASALLFWVWFLGTLICFIWLVCCRGGAFVLVDYIFVPMESHKACILPSVVLFLIVPLCSVLPEGKARFLLLNLSFYYMPLCSTEEEKATVTAAPSQLGPNIHLTTIRELISQDKQ